jgi:hypothetical protein
MLGTGLDYQAIEARDGRYPITPDGRYFAVRGRLWRMANPFLDASERARFAVKLMEARRNVGRARRAGEADLEKVAHAAVDFVKRALGERGPVWWTDGAPDLSGQMARDTPYAEWFKGAENAPDAGAAGPAR